MRGVKAEFKELDFIFAHERQVTDKKWLEVITTSYAVAQERNMLAAELAGRRYREQEHRYKSCRQLFISEAQYYKMLSLFLRIAKAEERKIFSDQK